jgi:hypothetical protein
MRLKNTNIQIQFSLCAVSKFRSGEISEKKVGCFGGNHADEKKTLELSPSSSPAKTSINSSIKTVEHAYFK